MTRGRPLIPLRPAAESGRPRPRPWPRSQFGGRDPPVPAVARPPARHLVLFGDPSGNALPARATPRLPVGWSDQGVTVGAKTYPAAHHVPVLVYPNPLNPRRYVVLNSGFTFREADHSSNARQTPKLPDRAVINLATPPGPRASGHVADAGFFGERWEVRPAGEKPQRQPCR